MTGRSIRDAIADELRSSPTLLPPPSTRRNIREAAGISRAQLAAVLGVTRQTIIHWETGVRFPSDRHRRAYIEALDAMREAVTPTHQEVA